MSKIISGSSLTLDARTMLPIATGTCDGGDCDRGAVSFAYDGTGYAEGRDGLIPVCRHPNPGGGLDRLPCEHYEEESA